MPFMSVYFASLNSGSNGNCYYIGNDSEAILVDAGISCRETERRMKKLGLPMNRVKAIFISHEHGDHIKGVEGLSTKYRLPVYITQQTFSRSRLQLPPYATVDFSPHQPIIIGALTITAFPKQHDAVDAHSFIISCGSMNVGVFTDIGAPCENFTSYFSQCHAAFLEANYDEQMLEDGKYPHHLKQRIRGGKGHLSNVQALELFTTYRPDFMSHLLLAHLSKENNCPELVTELFRPHSGTTEVLVAPRTEPTEVFRLDETGAKHFSLRSELKGVQASLF